MKLSIPTNLHQRQAVSLAGADRIPTVAFVNVPGSNYKVNLEIDPRYVKAFLFKLLDRMPEHGQMCKPYQAVYSKLVEAYREIP